MKAIIPEVGTTLALLWVSLFFMVDHPNLPADRVCIQKGYWDKQSTSLYCPSEKLTVFV